MNRRAAERSQSARRQVNAHARRLRCRSAALRAAQLRVRGWRRTGATQRLGIEQVTELCTPSGCAGASAPSQGRCLTHVCEACPVSCGPAAFSSSNPGPHGYGWLSNDQRRPRPSAHRRPAGSPRPASHPIVPPGQYHVAVIERVDGRRSIYPAGAFPMSSLTRAVRRLEVGPDEPAELLELRGCQG